MPSNPAQAAEAFFEDAQTLPELHVLLDGVRMKNGWAKPTPSLYPEPKQRYVPAHWSYSDAHAALHAAGRLVGTEWAERRNLILANPVPGNDYPTVETLVAAYQMVKAGEKARSHRHTPNAMRIVVEAAGETVYTVVDGTKVPMQPGDVLLTPNWCYHGHSNESDADAYWIDILDAPLVQALGPMFFEHHPERLDETDVIDAHSPMRFAFSEYGPRLLAQPETSPGVRHLELGPQTLATSDRTAVHLRGGANWKCSRGTSSRIFVPVRGRGTSRIGDASFEWAPGDVFVVPHWVTHSHAAHEDAVLIQVTDAPLLAKLGWLREDALPA